MKALVVEHVALSAKFGVVPSQVRARVDRLAKSELARSVESPAAQCELEAIDLAIAPEALRECIDIQRRVAAAAPTARPLHVALVTLEFTQRGHSDGPIASAHARPFFGSATNHDNLRTPTGPSPEGKSNPVPKELGQAPKTATAHAVSQTGRSNPSADPINSTGVGGMARRRVLISYRNCQQHFRRMDLSRYPIACPGAHIGRPKRAEATPTRRHHARQPAHFRHLAPLPRGIYFINLQHNLSVRGAFTNQRCQNWTCSAPLGFFPSRGRNAHWSDPEVPPLTPPAKPSHSPLTP